MLRPRTVAISQKSPSISARDRATLTPSATSQIVKCGVGMEMAYFLDW
jgi:hypothetical protein